MHFRGEEIESLRGRVGYMMQKDLLFPWRTVLGNVLLGLETRGVDRAEAEARARDYLKAFGLSGFENAYPENAVGRDAAARGADPHADHGSGHPAAR